MRMNCLNMGEEVRVHRGSDEEVGKKGGKRAVGRNLVGGGILREGAGNAGHCLLPCGARLVEW